MIAFILAILVLGTPLTYSRERVLLLFDEEGRPRCRVGQNYGEYLSSEKFKDFVREGDFAGDLRECGREDALYAGLVLAPEDIHIAGPVSDTTAVTAVAIPSAIALFLSSYAHRTGLALPMRLSMGVIAGTNATLSCYGGKLNAEEASKSNHWSAAGAMGFLSGFYATTLRYVDVIDPKGVRLTPRVAAGSALKDQAVNLAAALISYWSCQRIFAKEEVPPAAVEEGEEVRETFILYGEDGEGPDHIRH